MTGPLDVSIALLDFGVSFFYIYAHNQLFISCAGSLILLTRLYSGQLGELLRGIQQVASAAKRAKKHQQMSNVLCQKIDCFLAGHTSVVCTLLKMDGLIISNACFIFHICHLYAHCYLINLLIYRKVYITEKFIYAALVAAQTLMTTAMGVTFSNTSQAIHRPSRTFIALQLAVTNKTSKTKQNNRSLLHCQIRLERAVSLFHVKEKHGLSLGPLGVFTQLSILELGLSCLGYYLMANQVIRERV